MSSPALTGSPHDRALVGLVRPPDWVNPEPARRYHLVVIGAGTAGLVTAAGAAGLGARVALIERRLMGGDCLVTGCVPSKAILAGARAVAAARAAQRFGVAGATAARVDFPVMMERMRALRAAIAPHDSAARFRDLGVDVFFGSARFAAGRTVEVENAAGEVTPLCYARAVIATGARPAVPPIPGLADCGFRTSDTVFDLESLPARLLVVGAGPIGCELAQAFARFGARVTVVEQAAAALPLEDPSASAPVVAALGRDGVELRVASRLERVERLAGARGPVAAWIGSANGSGEQQIEVDEILVAVGRTPNVEGLGLESVGVGIGRFGVEVDDFQRTANRRILAAGDVASPWRFTHAADVAARTVIQNALFPFARRRSRLRTIPRVVYTEPELARVGLGESEVAASKGGLETFEVPFAEVDRARIDGETEGFVRVHVDARRGTVVGATIVGRDAGELISEITTAIAGKLKIGDLAAVIHPYPTRAEAIRKAGDAWNRRRLTPTTRRWLDRYLRRLI